QGVVTFLQQARLLEEQVHDLATLRRLVGRDGDDGVSYKTELMQQTDDQIVVRTVEAKTGHATTHHVQRAALEANEYHRLADVHEELEALVGSPPFHVKLGESRMDAISFEELRDAVLALAQKGIPYYRFKGLGEMDAEELRET